MAQYWPVIRQGTWHSTGLLSDKVHGTVLACCKTMYVAQYWLVIKQGTWHSTSMLLSKIMWHNIHFF